MSRIGSGKLGSMFVDRFAGRPKQRYDQKARCKTGLLTRFHSKVPTALSFCSHAGPGTTFHTRTSGSTRLATNLEHLILRLSILQI